MPKSSKWLLMLKLPKKKTPSVERPLISKTKLTPQFTTFRPSRGIKKGNSHPGNPHKDKKYL